MKTKTIILNILLCAMFTRLLSQTYSVTDSLALLEIDISCDASDNLNWDTEPDPGNWEGVTWNSDNPKRVLELDVNNKSLIGAMDVSDMTSLAYLNCENNQLTFLDLSVQVNLINLHCNINQLTLLDVSALTNLTILECAYNQLTSLDISALTNLSELECAFNQLNSLVVSALTNLAYLHCSYNQLTSLDVSELLNLNALTCAGNQLTVLDVSNLVNLTRLQCSNNALTVLDVSNLIDLTDLGCYMNQLTSLDVSSLTNLNYLYCSSNQLTSLDVSTLTNLTTLECDGNRLPFSSLATGLHVDDFNYIPQDTIFGPQSNSGNTTIDYSEEALIDGTATQFVFYKDGSEAETNTTGLFTTTGPGEYFCTMTNTKFPDLTLTTATVTITEATGVDYVHESGFIFYPNPVADKLNIRLSESDLPPLTGIYTMNGKELIFIENTVSTFEIDMGTLQPGIYILKITTPGSSIEEKIVKL